MGDVILDPKNAVGRSDDKLVALGDVVVVSTNDAKLVAHKERVKETKTIVSRSKDACRFER